MLNRDGERDRKAGDWHDRKKTVCKLGKNILKGIVKFQSSEGEE